jgi:hypothetical protein
LTRGGQKTKSADGKEMTQEQTEIYKDFNRMLDSLDIQNLFKDF